MAHTCPECGQECYCSGDLEDHDTGEEFDEVCTHCDGCQGENEDEDDHEMVWTTPKQHNPSGTTPPEGP